MVKNDAPPSKAEPKLTLTPEELTITEKDLSDEQRRQVWIEHYVEQGEYQEAVALGWDFAQPPDPRLQLHQQEFDSEASEALPIIVSPRVDALAENFLSTCVDVDGGTMSPGLSPDVPELPEEYRARIAAQNLQVRQALEKVRDMERDHVFSGAYENPMKAQRDGVVKLILQAEEEDDRDRESESSMGLASPKPLPQIKKLNLQLGLSDQYQMAAVMWKRTKVQFLPRVVLRRENPGANGGFEICIARSKLTTDGVNMVWEPWRKVIGAKIRSLLRWEFTVLIETKSEKSEAGTEEGRESDMEAGEGADNDSDVDPDLDPDSLRVDEDKNAAKEESTRTHKREQGEVTLEEGVKRPSGFRRASRHPSPMKTPSPDLKQGEAKEERAKTPKEGAKKAEGKKSPSRTAAKHIKVTFRATDKAEMIKWLEGVPTY